MALPACSASNQDLSKEVPTAQLPFTHNNQICFSGECCVPLVVSVVHGEHERKLAGTQVGLWKCECPTGLQRCMTAARAAPAMRLSRLGKKRKQVKIRPTGVGALHSWM